MLLCVLGVGMGSMLRASSPMDGHHPAAVSMSSSVWVIPLSPPPGVHPQVGWPATHTVLNLEHSVSHTTSVTSHPPVELKGPISPLHAVMPPSPSPSPQASLMTTLHTSLHHLCLSQQGRHPWDRVGTELPPLTFSFEALCLCQVLLRRWGLLRGPQVLRHLLPRGNTTPLCSWSNPSQVHFPSLDLGTLRDLNTTGPHLSKRTAVPLSAMGTQVTFWVSHGHCHCCFYLWGGSR